MLEALYKFLTKKFQLFTKKIVGYHPTSDTPSEFVKNFQRREKCVFCEGDLTIILHSLNGLNFGQYAKN